MSTLTKERVLTERGAGRPAWLRGTLTFVRRKPLGVAGLVMLLALIITGIFAHQLAPDDPLLYHPADTYTRPGHDGYVLGSDDRGRDLLSRIVYGARIALQVGGIAVGLGVTTGLIVGLVSGYVGGKTDFIVQRVVDSFQSFPALFLALAVTTALGQSVQNVGIALAIVTWPAASRVVRSAVLTQKGSLYIEAARAVGVSTPRILYRHILPNVVSVYIILATAGLAQAILVEASLSFLGAGVPPPQPSWGLMLYEAQTRALRAPWMVIFPGIAITIAVFGFNLFGDALRDHLDPRLRGR